MKKIIVLQVGFAENFTNFLSPVSARKTTKHTGHKNQAGSAAERRETNPSTQYQTIKHRVRSAGVNHRGVCCHHRGFLHVIGGCLGSDVGQRRKCIQKMLWQGDKQTGMEGCRQSGDSGITKRSALPE